MCYSPATIIPGGLVVTPRRATLVEHQSWFNSLLRVEGKDTGTVARALTRHFQQLPSEVRRSLTSNRGSEMDSHKTSTVATDVQVYFFDLQWHLAARRKREHPSTPASVLFRMHWRHHAVRATAEQQPGGAGLRDSQHIQQLR